MSHAIRMHVFGLPNDETGEGRECVIIDEADILDEEWCDSDLDVFEEIPTFVNLPDWPEACR